MEEIKAPKKERKFLKAVGNIGKVLAEELIMGIARKFIGKVVDKVKLPKKRETLSILLLLSFTIAFAQFPTNTNKQRLGFQTTADGLVWRGSISDTSSIQPVSNQNAWVILDTVNLKIYSFDFTSNVWNQVGGGAFAQPIDSLFFKTSAPPNNVDTAKMRWDNELGTVVLGMYDAVPNEIGFKNFWLVKNQTGSTITKGSIVYANGTVGASGRITVAKFIANGTIDAKYLLGITAHDLTDGEDGYVISFGKIRQVNTDTFAAGAILYPSPTVAGVWTDVEPVAPNIDMPIGFCINSSVNNGTIAIRVASGYKLSELHDIAISSPIEKASLYYSGGLWRDTTAALLVSDTAAMLANYSLKGYVDSIAQNFQDSIDEITNGYFKQEFPTVTKDTLNWTKPVQLPIGGSNLLLVYRNGQMINDAQYSVIDTNKVKINSGSYKLGENYTVVYVKGGGGSGSGGVPFDTSVLNLQARLDLKLNISDTAAMLANYATKAYADTTGRFYARQDFSNVSSSTLTWTQSDTLVTGNEEILQVYRNGQILLPSQYTVVSSTSITIAATSYKAGENYTVIFPRGGGAGSGGGSGSLTSISAGTGITVSPNPITTTGTVSADLTVLMELTDTTLLNLTTRFATKQNNLSLTTTGTSGAATLVGSTLNIPQYSSGGGSGTVTSVGTGYGLLGGPITTTGTLTVDTSTVYDFVRDSIVSVEIGGDTIKILKQEYTPATSDTLTWTVTSKFPIQLRQFILLFRNGQLLLNDQFSIIDTNKVKVAASSFKLGENYTLVTVSGIGSVSSGQGNPVYPEAGIALSTGTTWTTSITNNSSNWNTAFTDRLKWDGGSTGLVAATGRTSLGGTTIGQNMFTLTNPSAITFPRFNADNTVTALSAASFRSAIGAGTVTSVTASGTAGNPLSITNTTTTPTIELLSATSGRNGYLTSTDWTTFNNKQNAITLTTTGTSGASTLVGSTLNIPQYTSGGGTVTNVTGTLPISVTNGTTTPDISISNASTTTSGVVTTGTQSFSGAKTFTSATVINGGLVVNEDGSSVGTFRVEGDNNISLIQTLPASDYVGIGRVPENSFDVQGAVRFRTLTLNGTPTRIIGADATGDINQIALGSGLSLSSGTLSATNTGTVTNVIGTLPISVANGTTTPSITIANASTSASGVVTTGTQSFAGAKTFTNIVGFQRAIQRPVETITVSSASITTSNTWVIVNNAGTCTLTLPSAGSSTGTEFFIKTITNNAVVSASSNIVPLAGGSASTSILSASAGKWATLVSDGINWVIMQAN